MSEELDWEAAVRHIYATELAWLKGGSEIWNITARYKTTKPLWKRYWAGERTVELHEAMMGVE
jgi:hypothetical protein